MTRGLGPWGMWAVSTLSAVVAGAALTGCPSTAGTREDSRGSLSGTVVLRGTGALADMTRVRVDLGRGEGAVTPSSDGTFSVGDLEPDVYTVSVTYVGGLTPDAMGSAYAPLNLRAVVRAGGAVSLGAVALEPGRGTVSGRLVVGGQPKGGARVQLVGGQVALEAPAPDGLFSIPDVPVGAYGLRVSGAASSELCAALVTVGYAGQSVALGDVDALVYALRVNNVDAPASGADVFTTQADTIRVEVTGNAVQAARLYRAGTPPPELRPAVNAQWTEALTSGATDYRLEVQDPCGALSAPRALTLVRDNTPPAVGLFQLGPRTGDADVVQAAAVRLRVDATDDFSSTFEVRLQQCEDAVCTPATLDAAVWVPLTPVMVVAFADTDGPKSVRADVRDAAGNITTGLRDGVVLDRNGPGGALTVRSARGDTQFTSSTLVEVDFSSVDASVTLVALANDDAPDCDATPYTVRTSDRLGWFLSSEDGLHTVHACLRTESGAQATASATITLDATPPTSPRLQAWPRSVASSAVPPLVLLADAVDGTSGLLQPDAYVVSAGAAGDVPWNGQPRSTWLAPGSTTPITLGQGLTVWSVVSVDRAGNRSAPALLLTELDTEGPSAPRFERVVPLNRDVVVTWAPPVDEAPRAYRIHYGAAGGTLAAGFLQNGPSPLTVDGATRTIRLRGAPLGRRLFLALSAVDDAGNEGPLGPTVSVAVEEDGMEALATLGAPRGRLLRGSCGRTVAGVAGGFEVVDLPGSGSARSLRTVVAPLGRFAEVVTAGTYVEDAPCGTGGTAYVVAYQPTSGVATQKGLLLRWRLGPAAQPEAWDPTVVEERPLAEPALDVQAVSGASPRVVWMTHDATGYENGLLQWTQQGLSLRTSVGSLRVAAQDGLTVDGAAYQVGRFGNPPALPVMLLDADRALITASVCPANGMGQQGCNMPVRAVAMFVDLNTGTHEDVVSAPLAVATKLLTRWALPGVTATDRVVVGATQEQAGSGPTSACVVKVPTTAALARQQGVDVSACTGAAPPPDVLVGVENQGQLITASLQMGVGTCVRRGSGTAMCVAATTAQLGDTPVLHVVASGNPAEPRVYTGASLRGGDILVQDTAADGLVLGLAQGGSARDLMLEDGVLYVANGGGGLQVWDVSRPDAPVLTASVPVVQNGATWEVSGLTRWRHFVFAVGPQGTAVFSTVAAGTPRVQPTSPKLTHSLPTLRGDHVHIISRWKDGARAGVPLLVVTDNGMVRSYALSLGASGPEVTPRGSAQLYNPNSMVFPVVRLMHAGVWLGIATEDNPLLQTVEDLPGFLFAAPLAEVAVARAPNVPFPLRRVDPSYSPDGSDVRARWRATTADGAQLSLLLASRITGDVYRQAVTLAASSTNSLGELVPSGDPPVKLGVRPQDGHAMRVTPDSVLVCAHPDWGDDAPGSLVAVSLAGLLSPGTTGVVRGVVPSSCEQLETQHGLLAVRTTAGSVQLMQASESNDLLVTSDIAAPLAMDLTERPVFSALLPHGDRVVALKSPTQIRPARLVSFRTQGELRSLSPPMAGTTGGTDRTPLVRAAWPWVVGARVLVRLAPNDGPAEVRLTAWDATPNAGLAEAGEVCVPVPPAFDHCAGRCTANGDCLGNERCNTTSNQCETIPDCNATGAGCRLCTSDSECTAEHEFCDTGVGHCVATPLQLLGLEVDDDVAILQLRRGGSLVNSAQSTEWLVSIPLASLFSSAPGSVPEGLVALASPAGVNNGMALGSSWGVLWGRVQTEPSDTPGTRVSAWKASALSANPVWTADVARPAPLENLFGTPMRAALQMKGRWLFSQADHGLAATRLYSPGVGAAVDAEANLWMGAQVRHGMVVPAGRKVLVTSLGGGLGAGASAWTLPECVASPCANAERVAAQPGAEQNAFQEGTGGAVLVLPFGALWSNAGQQLNILSMAR